MFRNLSLELLIALRLVKRPDLTIRIMDRQPSPADLVAGVLVIVIGGGKRKWACFQCPGGCGNRFQLSLNPNQQARWNIEYDFLGRATVSPSIHQKDSCRAHFWIRNGNVTWCADSGHQTFPKQIYWSLNK